MRLMQGTTKSNRRDMDMTCHFCMYACTHTTTPLRAGRAKAACQPTTRRCILPHCALGSGSIRGQDWAGLGRKHSIETTHGQKHSSADLGVCNIGDRQAGDRLGTRQAWPINDPSIRLQPFQPPSHPTWTDAAQKQDAAGVRGVQCGGLHNFEQGPLALQSKPARFPTGMTGANLLSHNRL